MYDMPSSKVLYLYFGISCQYRGSVTTEASSITCMYLVTGPGYETLSVILGLKEIMVGKFYFKTLVTFCIFMLTPFLLLLIAS